MRPDQEDDSPVDDIPAWERDPVVANALRDAMTVKSVGLSWEEALSRVLSRRNVQLGGATRGRNSLGVGAQTLRQLLWPAVISIGVVALCVGIFQSRTNTIPARTYTTRFGQRTTVHLTDGTTVVLAPQTSLLVDAGFGGAHRDVYLTGEAYFDVTSVVHSPFVVHTKAMTTRVLGTEFTIRHYDDDPTILVAVRSGKVATGRRTPVTLTANMVAQLTDSTVNVAADADLHEYMEWTSGRLVFTKALASEVTAVLGHWYGLTFRFADTKLADQHLTGVFDDHEAPQEVLRALQLMLGVTMQFNGNIVTCTPAHASAMPRPMPGMPHEESVPHAEVGR